MPLLASLSLTPAPDAVPQALAWLEAVAQQQQWSSRTAFKLGLCLDEALSNIVMYGFKAQRNPAEDPLIELSILSDGYLFSLEIIDNGAAFDPVQNESRELAESLDEADIGGHGLRLMRHYLHDIEYHHANGRNHLRLTASTDAPGP